MKIPVINTEQMQEVDRLMIEVYGIELVQMMENAGRNLADFARDHYMDSNPVGKRVLVLVGSGGNGGGGLVAARRLHNWGAEIHVFTTKILSDICGVPGHQAKIINNIGLQVTFSGDITELPEADLILDAIIGYSLSGQPRGQAANLIQMANKHDAAIISLDVPSGIDTTNGNVYNPHIIANATMTLALPKIGLLKETAKESVGELFLADISVPPGLYKYLDLNVGSIFSKGEIISI